MTITYHPRLADGSFRDLDIDNLPDVFAELQHEQEEDGARYVTIWSHSSEWEDDLSGAYDGRTATGTLFCDASPSDGPEDQCDGHLWFGSDEGMPSICAKHLRSELAAIREDDDLVCYGIVTGLSEQPDELPADWEDLPMQFAPLT